MWREVRVAIGESSSRLLFRDPDIRIMLRVRNDEPGAFEVLVENYQRRLVGVLHHLLADAAEAVDLAEEVFLRIYRAEKVSSAGQVLDVALHDSQ